MNKNYIPGMLIQNNQAFGGSAYGAPAAPAYAPKKKIRPQMTRFDIFAAVLNFILTYLLIYNVVFSIVFSWVTTAVYLGFFVLASSFIIAKQKKFNREAIFPGVFAVLTSLTFSLHENTEINIVSFLLLIYLSGSYCIKLTESQRHSTGSYFYLLDVLKCEFLLPLKNIFLPFLSIGTLKTKKRENKNKNSKKAIGIILGILLGIPVLLIVIPLLTSGDAAFDALIGTTFTGILKWFEKFIEKSLGTFDFFTFSVTLFLTFIVSPFIYSVMFSFRHGVSDKENENTGKKYENLRFAPSNLVGGFLGIISVVYVIYLLSQLSYLFSAFTGHLPGGMTVNVAQYARRGFFEMTKIAGVNFAVIAVSILFAKRKEKGKLSSIVKWFDLFLCVFTIILISTSISKILLYISSFGLSHKRIYVFVFDIVLVVSFLSIIIRIFKESFPYMKFILGSACVAVLALGMAPVDTMISANNVDNYLSGKTDTIDIYEYSSVGIQNIKSLDKLAQSYTKVSQSTKEQIAYMIGYAMSEDNFSIGIYNLDRLIASRYIKANLEHFKAYCNEYYIDNDTIYVFANSDIKIKSVQIGNDWCIYETDKTGAYKNFELVKFKENLYKEPDEEFLKSYWDYTTAPATLLLIIEDENGNIYKCPIFQDYTGVIELGQREDEIFANVLSTCCTYNKAVEVMQKVKNDKTVY